MIKAARLGGTVALEHFRQEGPVDMIEKAPRDYQLEADRATERAIARVLAEHFADVGIAGEEKTSDRDGVGDRCFVIDPIDGTSNFAFRIPFFAQVISYLEAGEIVAGVVYDPLRDEMFIAEKGKGAWLNNKRLPPLENVAPHNCVISVGLPIPGQLRNITRTCYENAVNEVVNKAAVTRRLGSAALSIAYIAAGRHHAFFEDGLGIMDYLASALLVRECGGIVTDFYGVDQNGDGAVLASTPSLHPWLLGAFSSSASSAV